MRKGYSYLIGSIVFLTIIFVIYNVFTNYVQDRELANFPIPKSAQLDFKTNHSKHFQWSGTTGTELQFTYQLAIKRTGWDETPVDGQMYQYKKNEHTITVIPSTDYLEIILEQSSRRE